MRQHDNLTLAAGPLELQLAPAAGGRIVAFSHRTTHARHDLFKPGDNRFPASFMMLPFVGRIRDGRVDAGRTPFMLTPNLPGHQHPIHGYAWQRDWQVCAAEPAVALLEYQHVADEWPFSFIARQHFSLDEGGLTVLLSLENLSSTAMPYSLGMHPFFNLTPCTSIRATADEQWEMDADVFPVRHHPEKIGLKSGVLVSKVSLDTVFSRWRNTAIVEWPEWRLRAEVASADLDHLVIWTPPGEAFFGLEPISEVPGQFALLNPGAVRLARIRFDILRVKNN